MAVEILNINCNFKFMKLKFLLLLFISSCSLNNDLENNSIDIELPALRYNQSTAQSYRVLKTTISDPTVFDSKFPATDLSIGYVLRYYFYTGIDLSSTKNELISMDITSFDMPDTDDPVELARAAIYEIRNMSFGSEEYRDFVNKYFSGCIDIDKISRDCVIPTLYEPVCGCDGFTYSNNSAAECNGITNYYEGPCR